MAYHDAIAGALLDMLYHAEIIMGGLAIIGLMWWVYRLFREL